MVVTDFDRWARHYDQSALYPAYTAAHDAVLRRVRRCACRPATVLDVGCGTGRLLRSASRLFPGAVLVGLDLSVGMLSVAGRATCIGLRRVQATAERLPFAEGRFDLVVSTASFRHWTDLDAAVAEIGRVLAPGGLLCLADLIGSCRHGLRARLARRPPLPSALAAALGRTCLDLVGADTVDGFGPVSTITVVLAQRPRRARRSCDSPAVNRHR